MRGFRVVERRDVIPKQLDRYYSFPQVVRTGPGELLMGYRDARSQPNAFAHGTDGDFALMRYRDSRWSEPELLYRHEGNIEEMSPDSMTALSDGTILLFTRRYGGAHGRTEGVYLARSTDHGKTFGPRRRINLPFFPNGWAAYGRVIESPAGEWLMGAYGIRGGEAGYTAACVVSRDGGEHWEWKSWIAECGCLDEEFARKRGFPEPFMLLLPGGRIYCLLRTNGTFYATSSQDEGASWRAPQISFDGNACAGIVLSGGEMMYSYRGTGHEVHVPGQRVSTVKQRKGRLYCFRVSADGGATWSEEGVLDDGEAWLVGSYGMGDLEELEPGRIFAVYYTSDRDQAPWIQQCMLVPR
jgi:hypothetical protein